MLEFVYYRVGHRGPESLCDSTRSHDLMPQCVCVCLVFRTSARSCTWSLPCYILPDTYFIYVRVESCQQYDSDGACLWHSIAPPHDASFAGDMRSPCASTTHWFHHSFMESDVLSFIQPCTHSLEGGSGAICSGCSFINLTKEPGTHESTHLEDTRYKMERVLTWTWSEGLHASLQKQA